MLEWSLHSLYPPVMRERGADAVPENVHSPAQSLPLCLVQHDRSRGAHIERLGIAEHWDACVRYPSAKSQLDQPCASFETTSKLFWLQSISYSEMRAWPSATTTCLNAASHPSTSVTGWPPLRSSRK